MGNTPQPDKPNQSGPKPRPPLDHLETRGGDERPAVQADHPNARENK